MPLIGVNILSQSRDIWFERLHTIALYPTIAFNASVLSPSGALTTRGRPPYYHERIGINNKTKKLS